VGKAIKAKHCQLVFLRVFWIMARKPEPVFVKGKPME